ncbi:EamA family transporter RarD [Piscinibacter terrae]|uniref:EamA family transporter RarD n=1 Tax=Piscinibacter terrae TaxID=2496871 RepID=A0A3N7HRQ3_9BURK|nr:EamA family transporter RarD [Albitalea terrae]RQP24864.1 EamA family transporter RarD [Albitalea terrae]
MNPGILYAGLAYVIWGLFPLYFKQIAAISPPDVLAHRIVWSVLFVMLMLAVKRHWEWIRPALRQRRVVATFALTSVLLSANWLTYIWAVTHGHVVDASLGYFITPLVNVLLGYTVLKERLRPAQWTAVALAAAGVLWLALQGGQVPWIALVLACTFGTYGLLRKTAALGPLEGLTLETGVLLPPALAFLAWSLASGHTQFPTGSGVVDLMLVGIGPITAVPLLLFAAGARRIRLSTLGLLQYIGPSIQFGLGVWLYHEPFTGPRVIGFALIWTALLIYSAESLLQGQVAARRQPAMEPE